MSKLLFLTGMSGSGKSYWARQLSRTYNLKQVDMDMWIEKREGLKIADIIKLKGENRFREIEHAALKRLIRETFTDTVVACGGGTPCFFNNLALMKEAGKIVYLQATVQYLKGKLSHSHQRPLLQHGDMHVNLEVMLAKRKHIYEQADAILPTEDLLITDFEPLML